MAQPKGKPNRDLLNRAKFLTENGDLQDCLWLIYHGVPYDVAFSLPEDERLAYVVIVSGFEGLKFNWASGQFEKPSA